MSLRGLLQTLLCLLIFSAAGNSYANHAILSDNYSRIPSTSSPLKPVAVIYFNNLVSHSNGYLEAIKTMIVESKREFGLDIKGYVLDNESSLASMIDQIAEGETGMIIVIQPHDIESLMKIPSLYPDIHFSVIGLKEPMYLINVNSILFNEREGAFLSGALAALQSASGIISFSSKEDSAHTRNLAYAYFQGAKHINPEIQVVQQLGTQSFENARMPLEHRVPKQSSPKNPDIVYVLDEDILNASLIIAQKDNQLVIAPTPYALEQGLQPVLTSLLKHYDFALYTAIKSYATHNWTPVAQTLGLGKGYIDYIVDNRNRALFSTENIERAERTKDLVAQGVIKIAPLSQ